jgi:SAM-dependent methyltransferase
MQNTEEPHCNSCGSGNLDTIYETRNVPVHSVLLMDTREKARSYPKGDIELAYCNDCGFIGNIAFDPGLHEYSSKYEETQGFSATFNRFQKKLVQHLIDKYDLRQKDVIEIGCGKGEFLAMICEMGDNRGIGFDPAYVSERNPAADNPNIRFVKDFYSEEYAHYQGDFVCCKMTLEHIPRVAEFVRIVQRSIGDRQDTIVFFQIPNTRYVLQECAYWDIYYEHCSYFSAGSLGRLFRSCGFGVLDLYSDYNDQYLMIEARPGSDAAPHAGEESLAELRQDVDRFVQTVNDRLAGWKQRIAEIHAQGKKMVFWGGGSKCVAFISALDIGEEVPYAVDINPYKHHTFLPGSGHEIIPPEQLKDYRPDYVIVMNPIYCAEIGRDLNAMGLHPELLPV